MLVNEGLTTLPKRTKDIIVRRFGINKNETETLESIGRSYGITRERVRQIEDGGLKRLKRDEISMLFKPIVFRLESYLKSHGNLRKEETLLNDMMSAYYQDTSNNKEIKRYGRAISLILTISEPFDYANETEDTHALWMLGKESLIGARKIIRGLVDYFNSLNNVISEEDLMKWLISTASHVPREAHLSYLDVAKLVEKNIFGEYGLVHWPVINPRGVKDRAYLVLKKKGEPLHFTNVAELINQMGLSPKTAYSQTVHNELIKDPRFILVGRGLYALAEWGYKPGTVKDVIREVLAESNRPMTRQEIIDEVMKKRMVKTNTIILNINNSPEFQKTDDNAFILAE